MTRASWRRYPFPTNAANLPLNKIVGGPETLRWVNPIPAPGTKRAFMMMYANHHAYTYTAQSMKIGHEGPFKKYFVRAWAQRQEPLWTCFVTTKFKGQEAKIKRTMRSWVVRRIRMAFADSMERHGFTKDGESLEGNLVGPSIFGTAQFMAEEHVVNMSMADIGDQMDFCVKKMIAKQGLGQVVKPTRATSPWTKNGSNKSPISKNQKK